MSRRGGEQRRREQGAVRRMKVIEVRESMGWDRME